MIENVADVVEQRVDREVAAERVLLRCAEGVVAVDQAVAILAGQRHAIGDRLEDFVAGVGGGQFRGAHQATERGDFDRLRPEADVGQPETASDDPAVPEEPLDLVRMRRGADVEVLRTPAEQQIAHAAADEVGDVFVLVQPVEDFQRVGVDLAAGERVLRARDDDGFGHLDGNCNNARLLA